MTNENTKEWTLKELAAVTRVPERTIRFYISRGLVAPPLRGGRGAAYGEKHKERLEAVRALQAEGLTLARIETALEAAPSGRLPGAMVAAAKSGSPATAAEGRDNNPDRGQMLWFEKDGSLDRSQKHLIEPAAEAGKSGVMALLEPETWRSYDVAPDVRVLFRTETGPWRTKALAAALRRFAAEVARSAPDPDERQ